MQGVMAQSNVMRRKWNMSNLLTVWCLSNGSDTTHAGVAPTHQQTTVGGSIWTVRVHHYSTGLALSPYVASSARGDGQTHSNGEDDHRTAPPPSAPAAAPASADQPRMGRRRRGSSGPDALSALAASQQAVRRANAAARRAHTPRRRHGEGSRYVLCIRPCCSRLSSLLHESIHLARGSLIGDAIFVSVCLDGTPPGYHLQRGSGDGSNSWLIHLEVGAINHSHTFPKHT
jgi:hypothetical protein